MSMIQDIMDVYRLVEVGYLRLGIVIVKYSNDNHRRYIHVFLKLTEKMALMTVRGSVIMELINGGRYAGCSHEQQTHLIIKIKEDHPLPRIHL